MHSVLKADSNFRILPKFQFDSPYLADYFGIWSIYEPVFRGFVDSAAGMNLFAHVASQEIKQDVQSRDNRSFLLTDDGIAVIQIRGAMMKSVPSMGSGTSTVRVRQQLHDARRDPAVLGAMLVTETPGGTVNGNAALCEEAAKFAAEKPLYAFIDDLTASAGVSVVTGTAACANCLALNATWIFDHDNNFKCYYRKTGGCGAMRIRIERRWGLFGVGPPTAWLVFDLGFANALLREIQLPSPQFVCAGLEETVSGGWTNVTKDFFTGVVCTVPDMIVEVSIAA